MASTSTQAPRCPALLLALLAVSCCGADSENSAVVTLTDGNFDELTSEGSWILDFYAPWCGHCRKLEPEFQSAARQLQAMKSEVKLGKIDCTRNSKLKSRFAIKGYPTLKFSRDGSIRDYKSSRTADALVAYAKSVSGPAVRNMKGADVNAITNTHDVSFVFTGPKSSLDYKAFNKIARKYQGQYNFLLGDNAFSELVETEGSPAVTYLTKGGSYKHIYDLTVDGIDAFVEANKFALVSTMDSSTFSDIVNSGKLVALAVVDNTHASGTLEENLYGPASAFQKRLIITKIAVSKYARYLSRFGVKADDAPTVVVVDFDSEVYWQAEPGMEEEEQKIKGWLAGVIGGREPYTPLTSWYNPRRYLRKVSKFMKNFSDMQIMIITTVASLIGAGMVFTCFSYFEPADEMYARPPPGVESEDKQHPKAD